eukprot:SAG31_NODE_15744_length_740_cov_1.366615_1_plen_83_part_10
MKPRGEGGQESQSNGESDAVGMLPEQSLWELEAASNSAAAAIEAKQAKFVASVDRIVQGLSATGAQQRALMAAALADQSSETN